MTLNEYIDGYNHAPDLIEDFAEAASKIVDDDILRDRARDFLLAYSEFENALAARGIEIG